MGLFLGFRPDADSVNKIVGVAKQVKEVFHGFDVDVRWTKPETYHLSVVYLGEKVSFLKILYFKYRLKKFRYRRFNIKLGKVKVGISRRYKELIYLEVLEGGEEMRKLCSMLRESLGLKRDVNLIPHLTLGRINKDLSEQETSNVSRNLSFISKSLKEKNISFTVSSIDMLKTVEDGYEVVDRVELL